MLPPAIPFDETARLRALRALHLLDSAPEERFDRITRLARRLFDVPIALVSLVDAERQWFKSTLGLDACETPRDVSFCGHAILSDDVLVVPDALLDARFADNPLVTGEPNVRFYAGCPLRVPGGHRLGTLCLIDRRPRTFDDDDLSALEDLARMAEHELLALQLATMDDLTSVSNRRGFEMLGQHALATCKRHRLPATVLFFDLDDFKAVNDAHGHAEGDRALADFARLLTRVYRESDVIGRLGGDEFVVLLTRAGADASLVAAARLRDAVREHGRSSGRGYALDFSVGAVEFAPARHTSIQAMLAEADALMYVDKQARRGLQGARAA